MLNLGRADFSRNQKTHYLKTWCSLFSLKLRIFGRNNFEQLFLLVFKRMLANKGKIQPAFYYLVLLIMFNFESHIQIDINIESLINEVSNNDIHEIINKNKSSLMTT